MPDIFLSYNREDQAVARRFAEGFERAGFSVWWDQALNPGEAFDRVTEQALEDAKVVVVLWSKKSVDSRWVRAEATQALGGNKLVPVMIEPCKRPIMFELTQTAELAHWKGETNDPAWQAFIVGLRRLVDKSGDSTNTTGTPTATHTNAPSRLSKHKQALVLGSLVLVIAIVGAGYVLKPATAPAANAEVKATPAAAQSEEHSIVVLPFRDLSTAGDQQTFADGTSEEVSNLLTSVPELKVIGQVSANYFRDKQEDLAQMRERLKVEYVLTGSVRKNGDDLRIGVQLVDTKDGHQLWNQNFTGQKQQLFDFQESIAKKVSEALQVRLGVGSLARRPGMTRNVAAWEEYRQVLQVRGTYDDAMVRDTASHLERALNLDPNFFEAASRLINLYEIAKPTLVGKSTDTELQRANELRAMLTKDETGQLLLKMSESDTAFVQGDFVKAERLMQEALTAMRERGFMPMDMHIKENLALSSGRLREAHQLLERDHAIDPLDVTAIFYLSLTTASNGDLPRAIALLQEAQTTAGIQDVALDGRLLEYYMVTHDVAHMKEVFEHGKTFAVSNQADGNTELMNRLDDRKGALEWLRKNALASNPGPLVLDVYSFWAAFFGDPQLALDLQSAMPKNGQSLSRMEIFAPNFAEMRKLPGFKKLVKDLGLVDYWRAIHNWGDFCQPLPNTESDFECH